MKKDPLSGPVTRRRFVGIGIAALVAVPLGSAWAVHEKWNAVRRRWEWYRHARPALEGRIRSHFDYLDLDPAGVSAFAREYETQREKIGFLSPPDPEVFQRYLLSTDFFQHGADESRTLRYVAFYDPYVSPCWNPCVRWT